MERDLDFRIGGCERLHGTFLVGRDIDRRATAGEGAPDSVVSAFDARYHEIVPNERIVYAYEMRLWRTLISISLASVELEPAPSGTAVVFTGRRGRCGDGLPLRPAVAFATQCTSTSGARWPSSTVSTKHTSHSACSVRSGRIAW